MFSCSDVCFISCSFRSLTWLVNNEWHSLTEGSVFWCTRARSSPKCNSKRVLKSLFLATFKGLQSSNLLLLFLLKNGESLSPAAATTAEEAMSVSPEPRASSRDVRVVPGDLGGGGAAALGSEGAAAGAEVGGEESAQESEAWAAAVPPVRAT